MPETLVDDDSTFVASVTVPTDLDARNAASVRAPFKALADRTAFLETQRNGGQTAVITLTPETAIYDPAVWTPVSLQPGQRETDNPVAKMAWNLNRLMPAGAIILQIDAMVRMGANRPTNSRMELSIENRTPVWSPLLLIDPGTPDTFSAAEAGAASGGAVEVFQMTGAPLPFTLTTGNQSYLTLRSRSDIPPLSPTDIAHAIRISFTDPGARNY